MIEKADHAIIKTNDEVLSSGAGPQPSPEHAAQTECWLLLSGRRHGPSLRSPGAAASLESLPTPTRDLAIIELWRVHSDARYSFARRVRGCVSTAWGFFWNATSAWHVQQETQSSKK